MNVHPRGDYETGQGDDARDHATLVAEHTRDAIIVTGIDGRVRWVNPGFERISGYTLAEVFGKKPGAVLQGPDTDPETVRLVSRRLAERAPVQVDIINYTKCGRPYWIEMDIAPVFDEDGHHTAFVAVERDVTERKELFLEMERARERDARRRQERRVLAETSEWLYAADTLGELDAIVSEAMPQLVRGGAGTLFIYRNSRDRLEPLACWGGEAPAGNLMPSDCWALRRGRSHTFGGQLVNVRCPHRGDDGRASVCVPLLAHGETLGMLSVIFPEPASADLADDTRTDFDERRQLVLTASRQIGLAIANVRLRAELRAHATRDVLTGLPNRRWFLEALRDAVAEATDGGAPAGLLSVDVDNFKIVNDTYGHSAGDAVLRMLAAVMNETVGAEGTACRIGGEEFVVLLPGADLGRAATIAETLRARVAARRAEGSEGVPAVTVSVGVASAPEHATTADALLERADEALYQAKREGRDRIVTA